jgi:hypothetical protein
MKSLSSYVSFVQQKAAALFHRTDQLKSDSAERRQAWNRVIAEHQKPLDSPTDSGKITLTPS